jgi:hypothetical protein
MSSSRSTNRPTSIFSGCDLKPCNNLFDRHSIIGSMAVHQWGQPQLEEHPASCSDAQRRQRDGMHTQRP